MEHNLCYYICDVIKNKMLPRGLPCDQVKGCHDNNIYTIQTYMLQTMHHSFPVHYIELIMLQHLKLMLVEH